MTNVQETIKPYVLCQELCTVDRLTLLTVFSKQLATYNSNLLEHVGKFTFGKFRFSFFLTALNMLPQSEWDKVISG